MKSNTFFLFVALILFIACGGIKEKSEKDTEIAGFELSQNEFAFMENLKSLCGKSFAGRETYCQAGRESWAGKGFLMHVTVCEEGHVHIPFHVDEDKSRTWMFIVEDGRLRFRHDHRHEDGTPEDETLYGGYSDGNGTGFIQCFPADEYTENMLQDGYQRQWNIMLNEDFSVFTYELYVDGELAFAVEFDLANPL